MTDVPKYWTEWAGKRVQWKKHTGVVTDVVRRLTDGQFRTLVSIVRDDGFLSPWVDVSQVVRLSENNHKEPPSDTT